MFDSSYDETALFLPANEKESFRGTGAARGRSTIGNKRHLSQRRVIAKKPSYSWREIFSNQVLLIIIGLGILAFHTIAFEQLLPVLFSLPKSETKPELPFKFTGGFALSTKTIGYLLSSQGILQMFTQLFLYPKVSKKLGSLVTFRLAIFGYPFLYFLVPYLSLVPHAIRYPAILLVLIWKVTAQSLSFPSTNVMLSGAAPSTLILGTVYGFSASSASLARTFGPMLAGFLEAKGLKIGYSGLSWWIFSAISVVGAVVSLWQVEFEEGSDEDDVPIEPLDEDEESSIGETIPHLLDQAYDLATESPHNIIPPIIDDMNPEK